VVARSSDFRFLVLSEVISYGLGFS